MNVLSLPALANSQSQNSIWKLYLSCLHLVKFVISEWSVAVVLWISLVKQISRWLLGTPGSIRNLLNHFDEIS